MTWELGIPIMISGIIFVLGFLSIRIDKKHGALQLLFLFLCLYTIILALAINIEMANLQALTTIYGMLNGLYFIFIWATVFILFYFIIMLVWNAFAERKENKKAEEDDYYDSD